MAVEAGTTDPPGDGRDGSPGIQSVAPGTRAGATEAGRGRWDAAAAHQPRTTPRPADAPPQTGFLGGLRVKELATRVIKEVREDDCLGWAAQLAYYLLFAVFPFFLFLTALLGFLPIPNLLERIIASLAMVLPGEAVTLLQDNIRQLVTEQKGGLLSFGILAALWSSSSAVVAITAALNQAYDVEEGRPWWKVRGIALLLTMGLSLFLLLAVALLIFGPQLGRGLAPSWASVVSLKSCGIFCAGRSVRGSSSWRWRWCIILRQMSSKSGSGSRLERSLRSWRPCSPRSAFRCMLATLGPITKRMAVLAR